MDIDKKLLFLLIKHKVDSKYLDYFDDFTDLYELVDFLEKEELNKYELYKIATQMAIVNSLSEDSNLSMLDALNKVDYNDNVKEISEEERNEVFEKAKKLFNLE